MPPTLLQANVTKRQLKSSLLVGSIALRAFHKAVASEPATRSISDHELGISS